MLATAHAYRSADETRLHEQLDARTQAFKIEMDEYSPPTSARSKSDWTKSPRRLPGTNARC